MNNDRTIIVIATVLLQTLVSIILVMMMQWVEIVGWLKYALPVWQAAVGILAVLCIVSIRQMDEMNKEFIKNQFLKMHYNDIETLLTTSRTERHEYRKHLQALQSCIHLGLIEEAKGYIDGISGQVDTEEYLVIDNPVLFGLVNSKFALARSQGIIFVTSIQGNLSRIRFEPWDLNSILGNLLDNALEAAAASDKEQPQVGLEITSSEQQLWIKVVNNGATIVPADLERIFEPGYSTKGSQTRGYGLFVVKTLVDRYKGSIEIYSDVRTTIALRFTGEGNDQ